MNRDNCATLTPPLYNNPDKGAEITGFRLELIHFLRTPLRSVREVLSEVSGVDSVEDFFRVQSLESKKRLLLRQMKSVQPLSGSYTLNLSVRMLEDSAFIKQLAEWQHEHKMILEVQDPGELLPLNTAGRQRAFSALRSLADCGYRIWLDDLYPEYLQAWDRSGICFDAVKMDCHLFRQLSHSQYVFDAMVQRYHQAGRQVIVEGIETVEDYILCLRGLADAIQGYFFKSEWIRLAAC